MIKRAVGIAMAFVGVVVGAGFASGQEAIQFFVAFGQWGILGAVVASLLLSLSGMIVMKFGSYLLAQDHMQVLQEVAGSRLSRVLDAGVLLTLFSVGFVMFAGAGANLQQQFGLPSWAGAALMLALVVGTGFLDIDRVSQVIGACTPFIIFFILLATVFALRDAPSDLSSLDAATQQVQTGLPNWWVACLNYVGFTLIVGASMAIVIGGANVDTRAAGWGGLLGGLIFSVLLTCLVVSLWVSLPAVGQDDMPTLSLVTRINPVLGVIMAVVVYAMIYNTAIGMFYSMSRRLTSKKPHLFRNVYVACCLVGFLLSYVGFKDLVSFLYPTLGYLGVLLIAVLVVAYVRYRSKINGEIKRRQKIRKLVVRKLNPAKVFTKRHERELRTHMAASPVEDTLLRENIVEEVSEELVADESVAFTEAHALGLSEGGHQPETNQPAEPAGAS